MEELIGQMERTSCSENVNYEDLVEAMRTTRRWLAAPMPPGPMSHFELVRHVDSIKTRYRRYLGYVQSDDLQFDLDLELELREDEEDDDLMVSESDSDDVVWSDIIKKLIHFVKTSSERTLVDSLTESLEIDSLIRTTVDAQWRRLT